MGRIDWLPVDDVPSELRDGRYVLLWSERGPQIGFWSTYIDGDGWATHEGRPEPSLVAELHDPEGNPIYDHDNDA